MYGGAKEVLICFHSQFVEPGIRGMSMWNVENGTVVGPVGQLGVMRGNLV